MTSIYLDVCCLNRPFDDQLQDRIRLESEAVLQIIMRVQFGDWEWTSSQVVHWEIEQTPDVDKRLQVRLLASHAGRVVSVGDVEIARATELEALGFGAYDALHLSCAESAQAQVFLSTDDRLLRLAERHRADLKTVVENPLKWLEEEWAQ